MPSKTKVSFQIEDIGRLYLEVGRNRKIETKSKLSSKKISKSGIEILNIFLTFFKKFLHKFSFFKELFFRFYPKFIFWNKKWPHKSLEHRDRHGWHGANVSHAGRIRIFESNNGRSCSIDRCRDTISASPKMQ